MAPYIDQLASRGRRRVNSNDSEGGADGHNGQMVLRQRGRVVVSLVNSRQDGSRIQPLSVATQSGEGNSFR